MALIFHHPSHLLSLKPTLPHSPTSPNLIIKSQSSQSNGSSTSSSSKPASQSNGSGPSTSSSSKPASQSNGPGPSTLSSQGQGFGQPAPKPGKKSSRRERAVVIRRAPVEKPQFFGSERKEEDEKQLKGESGFLLAWLGLGGVILFQGLALSVSGFLPEDWDKFLVKYIYPTFTPTVFLFVAGTVTYGVLKYLQNENLKN